MATYRDIDNSEVSEGAGVTQPLMQAMKDNQLAIPQGVAGAVRLRPAGLTDSTSNAQTKNTVVHAAKVQSSGWTSSNQNNDDVLSAEYIVGRGGSYGVHLYHVGNATSAVQIKLYKNGSVIQTTTNSVSATSVWYQLTFAAGDKIKIALVDGTQATTFTTGNAFIWIYTSNPFGSAAPHGLGIITLKQPSGLSSQVGTITDAY